MSDRAVLRLIDALWSSVDYCLEHGIMVELVRNRRMEVFNVQLNERDEKLCEPGWIMAIGLTS